MLACMRVPCWHVAGRHLFLRCKTVTSAQLLHRTGMCIFQEGAWSLQLQSHRVCLDHTTQQHQHCDPLTCMLLPHCPDLHSLHSPP
jgi:hypothetical protein